MDDPEVSVAPIHSIQIPQIGFVSTSSLMDVVDQQFTELVVQISPAFIVKSLKFITNVIGITEFPPPF